MRVTDARVLLPARRYAGCYYLVGYAIECGLKACIARLFHANTVPSKIMAERAKKAYTHRLDDLVDLAELREKLDGERRADLDFESNWNVVKDWNSEARYDAAITRKDAKDLYGAITDPDHGVLRWLRRHW